MNRRGVGTVNVMYVVGIVAMVGIALYVGFRAVDGWGLEERTGRALVVDKERVEPGSTYATQIIGGQRVVRRQATAELYVLRLELDGREAPAAVTADLFEAVEPGDEVSVTYEQRRITGTPRVLDVQR